MSKTAYSGPRMYQIDFNAVAAGRHIAMSKRRIRWRFGFPNREALEAGESGTACRGTEHDITVIWSVTSGKKVIIADSQHIHMSMDRSSVFDHSFNLRGNHVARICIHANPPTTSGIRQYELYIDGLSFFTLPKVFELGVKGSSSSPRVPGVITQSQRNGFSDKLSTDGHSYDSRKGGYTKTAPRSKEEEEEDLRKAIAESLKESKNHLVSKGRMDDDSKPSSEPNQTTASQSSAGAAPAPVVDLLDFSDPVPAPTPGPGAMVAVGAPQTQWAQTFNAAPEPAPVSQIDPFASTPQPMVQQPQATAMPHDPFSPKAPTYNDISNDILSTYSGAPQRSTVDEASVMGVGGMSVSTVPAMASNNPFDNASYVNNQQQQPGVPARPPSANVMNPPPQINYASPTNQYAQQAYGQQQQAQYGAGRPPMPMQQQQQQQAYGVPPANGQTQGYGQYQY